MEQKPVIVVLVGVTGDLSRRKLLPALAELGSAGHVPEHFRIVGITRQEGVSPESLSSETWVRDHLEIFSMDVSQAEEYVRLKLRLEEIEKEFAESSSTVLPQAQRLYYLSVPPDASRTVIGMLGNSGLAGIPDTKLLIEKPFGSDFTSAKEFLEFIAQHFSDEQVFRIDHYLAKEFARRFVVWREGNEIPKYYWNNEHLGKINFLASEKIGIENRANFYEQTGALRDLVQSHLLQLTALALMPLAQGVAFDTRQDKDLPQLRLEALQHIHLPEGKQLEEVVTLGQYEGYREEVKNPASLTETYVSLELASDDTQWKGIPIRLTTGKKLDKKLTEIRGTFQEGKAPNPNPAIAFEDFSVSQKGSEAYERVFLDAIAGDHTFFVSAPEILECWRIIEPVLEIQKELISSSSKTPVQLCIYKPGSTPF